MKLTDLFTIDGQPIPVPDGDMVLVTEDLLTEDSGRDESGLYHRFPVRRDLRSWDFSYSRLTREEMAYLEELFMGKDTFSFTYPLVTGGSSRAASAFRSRQSVLLHTTEDGVFRNCQFRITLC